MFALDVNMPEVNSMLFIHGKGFKNIKIWHEQIGCVDFQHFELMEK